MPLSCINIKYAPHISAVIKKDKYLTSTTHQKLHLYSTMTNIDVFVLSSVNKFKVIQLYSSFRFSPTCSSGSVSEGWCWHVQDSYRSLLYKADLIFIYIQNVLYCISHWPAYQWRQGTTVACRVYNSVQQALALYFHFFTICQREEPLMLWDQVVVWIHQLVIKSPSHERCEE